MGNEIDILRNGSGEAPLTFVLTHGAGAPMDTPFMDHIAKGVAAGGFDVARFEFPYMARRREDGKNRPPDRQPVLLDTWRSVIASLGADQLVIGGKSMGGRMASMIADEMKVKGLVCLGYPFHPLGKPERLRTEHLETLSCPTLIVQGERDGFGKADEVAGYALADSIQIHWLKDGDHSYKPRKSSGVTQDQNLDEAVGAIVRFLRGLVSVANE